MKQKQASASTVSLIMTARPCFVKPQRTSTNMKDALVALLDDQEHSADPWFLKMTVACNFDAAVSLCHVAIQ